MSITCHNPPKNKKKYITDIGKILVADYGKKRYYKPSQVKKAHKKSIWANEADFSCWAMCTFSSHSDFDLFHQKIGEDCSYVEMKTEMLNGIVLSESASLPDINGFDIDASWLDGDIWGNVFDFFSTIFSD